MYTTSGKHSEDLTLPRGVDPRLDGRVGYRGEDIGTRTEGNSCCVPI